MEIKRREEKKVYRINIRIIAGTPHAKLPDSRGISSRVGASEWAARASGPLRYIFYIQIYIEIQVISTTYCYNYLSPPIMNQAVDDPLLNGPKSRLFLTQYWLNENPTESIAVASKIFCAPRETIRNIITRLKDRQHGGQNEILLTSQILVLFDYIKRFYEAGFPISKQLIFAAIKYLRRLENRLT